MPCLGLTSDHLDALAKIEAVDGSVSMPCLGLTSDHGFSSIFEKEHSTVSMPCLGLTSDHLDNLIAYSRWQ